MTPGTQTVEIGDAPLVDDTRFGGKRRDWSAATWVEVTGCAVQPIVAEETNEGREFALTRLRLFAPYSDTVPAATSRVRYLDREYDVDGEPGRWHDHAGAGSHVEATLKLTER